MSEYQDVCMFILVPAHPDSPGQKVVKRLCVYVCVCVSELVKFSAFSDKEKRLELSMHLTGLVKYNRASRSFKVINYHTISSHIATVQLLSNIHC